MIGLVDRTAADLIVAKNRINKFRAAMGDRWGSPTNMESIYFALTECGEVLDALLRMEGDRFKRNRNKSTDLVMEYGDVIMMSVPLIPDEVIRAGVLLPVTTPLAMMQHVIRAAMRYAEKHEVDKRVAEDLLHAVLFACDAGAIEGYSPSNLVSKRLLRIFGKLIRAEGLRSLELEILASEAVPWAMPQLLSLESERSGATYSILVNPLDEGDTAYMQIWSLLNESGEYGREMIGHDVPTTKDEVLDWLHSVDPNVSLSPAPYNLLEMWIYEHEHTI